MSPLSSTITFIAAAGSAGPAARRDSHWSRAASCDWPGGRCSRHQVFKGRRPRQSASVILWNQTCHHAFRNVAKKSGKQKRKESRRLVLPRELPNDAKAVQQERLQRTATKATKATKNGDKKARAAQRAAQGRHLHGYQGCRQVQQERLQRSLRTATRRERRQEGSCCAESCSRTPSTWLPRLSTSTAGEATKKFENGDKTRMATRRLVLRRELLKDAIYMATKAVDKYSRRGYKEV